MSPILNTMAQYYGIFDIFMFFFHFQVFRHHKNYLCVPIMQTGLFIKVYYGVSIMWNVGTLIQIRCFLRMPVFQLNFVTIS